MEMSLLVLGYMINGNKDNRYLGTSLQLEGINVSNCIYPSGVGFDKSMEWIMEFSMCFSLWILKVFGVIRKGH